MELTLEFDTGIIDGDTMRFISEVFNIRETFKRRKSYDEYYFEFGTKITLDIGKLAKLASGATIKIAQDTLTIIT